MRMSSLSGACLACGLQHNRLAKEAVAACSLQYAVYALPVWGQPDFRLPWSCPAVSSRKINLRLAHMPCIAWNRRSQRFFPVPLPLTRVTAKRLVAGAALAKLLVFGPRERGLWVRLKSSSCPWTPPGLNAFTFCKTLQKERASGSRQPCSHAALPFCVVFIPFRSHHPPRDRLLVANHIYAPALFCFAFVHAQAVTAVLYFDGAQRTLFRAMLQLDDCYRVCAADCRHVCDSRSPGSGACPKLPKDLQQSAPKCTWRRIKHCCEASVGRCGRSQFRTSAWQCCPRGCRSAAYHVAHGGMATFHRA